jgi:hypothetical protein
MHSLLLFILLTGAVLVESGWTQTTLSTSELEPIPPNQLLTALNALPDRTGPEPQTPSRAPHIQIDQNAPEEMQQLLLAGVRNLPDVQLLQDTPFSLPSSIGWVLPEELRGGPDNAYYSPEGEFGHSHPPEDGSVHLRLPAVASRMVFDKGWGILHPFSAIITHEKDVNLIMLYGPRDEQEVKAAWIIAQISYAFARGFDLTAVNETAITPATWGEAKHTDTP